MKLITDRFKSPRFYTFMAGTFTAFATIRMEQKINEGYSLLALTPYLLVWMLLIVLCMFATSYFESKQDVAITRLYNLLDEVFLKELLVTKRIKDLAIYALQNREVKEHLRKYPKLYPNAITYLNNYSL